MRRPFELLVLIAAICLLVVSCASVSKRWKKAVDSDTSEAYWRFLEYYPDTPQADSARSRLYELGYQRAKRSNSVSSWRKFLSYYPAGDSTDQAKRHVEELRYQEAVMLDSESEYQRYLKEFPRSKHYGDVQDKLRGLLAERERQRFNLACQRNRVTPLYVFLRDFPSSDFEDRIRARIDSFQQRTLTQPMLVSWDEAGIEPLSSDNVDAYFREASRLSSSLFGSSYLESSSGNMVVGASQICFVVERAVASQLGIPLKPCKFTIDLSEGVLNLKVQEGANEFLPVYIQSYRPCILLLIGSEVRIESLLVASNVFGIECVDGSFVVRKMGLEWQVGTVVIEPLPD